MAISKSRRAANERYNNANYDRITVRLPAGRRELVEDMAADNHISINKYINGLLAGSAGVSMDQWNDPECRLQSDARVNAEAAGLCEVVSFRAPAQAMIKLQALAELRGVNVDVFINSAIAAFGGLPVKDWMLPIGGGAAAQQGQRGGGAEG